jgi:hypothetical protein
MVFNSRGWFFIRRLVEENTNRGVSPELFKPWCFSSIRHGGESLMLQIIKCSHLFVKTNFYVMLLN